MEKFKSRKRSSKPTLVRARKRRLMINLLVKMCITNKRIDIPMGTGGFFGVILF